MVRLESQPWHRVPSYWIPVTLWPLGDDSYPTFPTKSAPMLTASSRTQRSFKSEAVHEAVNAPVIHQRRVPTLSKKSVAPRGQKGLGRIGRCPTKKLFEFTNSIQRPKPLAKALAAALPAQ